MSHVDICLGDECAEVLKTAVCLTRSSTMREAGVNAKECNQKESRVMCVEFCNPC